MHLKSSVVSAPSERPAFSNVLFMRADDLPAMLESLRQWISEDPHALSFLSKLMPVTDTFSFQSPGEFEEKAKGIVLAWVPGLAAKGFHVRMRRRGFKGKLSGLEEEHFLDKVILEALEKTGKPGHITFEDPDAIIAVETIEQWAGLSLLERGKSCKSTLLSDLTEKSASSLEQKMKGILVIPIEVADQDVIRRISDALSGTFHLKVATGKEMNIPENSRNSRRKQYRATTILKEMLAGKRGEFDLMLGVTDADLYVPELNFVFGEADVFSGATIISLARLRQEF